MCRSRRLLPAAGGADLPEARRGDPRRAALHLCADLRSAPPAGLGAARRRRRPRRHRGDHGAEHPGDAGGALRRADGRRGAVLHQHPAGCRGDRASSCSTREAKVLLVDREFAGVAGVALRRLDAPPLVVDIVDPKRRAGRAARHDRLRGLPRRRRSRLRLAAAGRRVGGDRAELHLGHHRQSEGRRLPPPRRLSECLRQCAHLRADAAQRLSLDAADVPLQRLDLYLGGDPGRRHACLPAPRASRRRSSPRSPSMA